MIRLDLACMLLEEPKDFWQVKDGWTKVPQRPGLGVEISGEALEKFAWKIC